MSSQRTYWHLQALGRKPTDYEIATSRLLYHPQRGFEVNVPAAAWYERYQRGSPLHADDWELFADPRAHTYTVYVTQRNESEIYVDGLLRELGDGTADRTLAPEWLDTLERVLPVARYPMHALQMAAAYVGQMAPASRITIAAALQAADEMRRIQRFAYRMRQLQDCRPRFGADARHAWEQAPAWQPLRETLEQLLVTWDWGEAFVALNCAVKPVFDGLLMAEFARRARARGDEHLPRLLAALDEDCRWQRAWSTALLDVATPDGRDAARGWFERWLPRAERAAALCAALDLDPAVAGTVAAQRRREFAAAHGEMTEF
jgi:toluene monooxygenase system protein E